MKKRNKFIAASLFFGLMFYSALQAQEIPVSEKHHEEVTIIGTFDPSINDAFKINVQPEEEVNRSEKPVFEYQVLPIIHPTVITSDPITPIALNPEKREKNYNNTLLVGLGSLLTPYVDFYHASGKRNQNRFDARVHHLSSFASIPDYAKSPFSKTGVDLGYTVFLKNHLLKTGFAYQLNTNRYYGFKTDDFPDIDESGNLLKQSFNSLEANIGLQSNYQSNKKLHHEINLTAGYYFDKYSTNESYVRLDFNAYKAYELTELLNYQHLGISGKIDFVGATDSLTSSTSTLIHLMPYFKGHYDMINFTVGLQFNFLNTSAFDFYFYPYLHASANLVEESLTAFIGVDGEVNYNGYKKLTTENPWLNPTAIMNWDRGLHLFAGFRGNIAHQMNYSIQGNWTKFNALYFFVNQESPYSWIIPSPQNMMNAVYDAGSRIGVEAELTYTLQKNVKIMAGGSFYSYSLDSLSQPYHKPLSRFNLGATTKISSKITLEAEIIGFGKRHALDVSGITPTDVTLDPFIDLNAGISYQLKEQFAVWLNGTNLLNNHYERYYQYPVQGWQVMGGLTYKF